MVVLLGQFQREFQLKFDSRSDFNGFNCHKSMIHQQFIKHHHIFSFVYCILVSHWAQEVLFIDVIMMSQEQ